MKEESKLNQNFYSSERDSLRSSRNFQKEREKQLQVVVSQISKDANNIFGDLINSINNIRRGSRRAIEEWEGRRRARDGRRVAPLDALDPPRSRRHQQSLTAQQAELLQLFVRWTAARSLLLRRSKTRTSTVQRPRSFMNSQDL